MKNIGLNSFNIPKNIKYVIEQLNNAGYEAYVVGGCVRDSLLGLTPKDWDLTTNATPDEIRTVFKDYELINNNGEKHGTVTVRYNDENIEITTYRVDGEYKDNRHPESVSFTRNIKEDLARRDFTINAIAYNEKEGFVDPFGGVHDLETRKLKSVNKAEDRFNEDALRILRGMRFACKYNLSVDYDIVEAALELKNKLNNISKERIQTELNQMITYYEFTRQFIYNKDFREIIFQIIPELGVVKTDYLTKKIKNLEYKHLDYQIYLAALLECLSSKSINNVLNNLKYSNFDKKYIKTLIEISEYAVLVLDNVINTYCLKLILKQIHELFNTDNKFILRQKMFFVLHYLYGSSHDIKDMLLFEAICKEADELVDTDTCISLKQLAIKGDDLIKLDYKSKDIGNTLEYYLDEVMKDHLPNIKKVLMKDAEIYANDNLVD